MERRRRASTWPCGGAAQTPSSPVTAGGPSRLRRLGPMPFWWRCTQKAWRLCSAWMARSAWR